MPLVDFQNSTPLTLGVELELQLVSLSDFDLIAASPDLLHLLSQKKFPGNVTPEITESMIEISTDIHQHHASLLEQLQAIRTALVNAGDKLNIGICGGGTHPFQKWAERKIFSKQRYKAASSLYGYLAKQFTVFGQHIHVGCANGDEAMYLLHALNPYVPHFIALAASSPYIQRIDTLFDSSRLNSVFSFPLSGRAPFLLSWDEFSHDYFSKMEHTGIVRSMKDFYWDIRPKPEYGTIELRVCDTPLTVEKAAALACYLQLICHHLLQRQEAPPLEEDYLVYSTNLFQACRFGLDGQFIHPKTHEVSLIRETIRATLARVAPYAENLGGLSALTFLHQVLDEENDANFLRQQHTDTASLEGMVYRAIERFRTSS